MFYLTTHSTHFILRLYGVGHMVKDHSDREKGNPLPPHGLHFLLYAPSHRQDSTYHYLWYTSRGALAGTGNSSMGPPWRIDPSTHRTMSERSYHGATSRSHLEHCVRCSLLMHLVYLFTPLSYTHELIPHNGSLHSLIIFIY